jgi:uncharacterized protein
VRFLCDEMLRRLGRWLRAAGYDTVIAEGGAADWVLVHRAAAEDRILLTRDRGLAALNTTDSARIVLDIGNSLDGSARASRRSIGVDWELAPFTRCLLDNTPLEPLPPDRASQVPATAVGPHWFCPVCCRAYWPGGHVRRMRERLSTWQGAAALPN